jgi:hypothetical protein
VFRKYRFKAPDGSENGKLIKMDLTRSSPAPFIFQDAGFLISLLIVPFTIQSFIKILPLL